MFLGFTKPQYGEPWGHALGDSSREILTIDYDIVTADATPGDGDRICACVNAMAGIKSPAKARKVLEAVIVYCSPVKATNVYAACEETIDKLTALQSVVRDMMND